MPKKLVLDLKDHLPEHGLLVSTVFSPEDRLAETMVFRADARGFILDAAYPLYEERYPLDSRPEDLEAAHRRIVERARSGEWG